MGWKDFLPFEITPDKPSVLDVKKPIKEQVSGTNDKPAIPNFSLPGQPAASMYNNPAPSYQPDQAYTPQPAYTSSYQPAPGNLSPEDQKKWVDYMNTIYNDARKSNPIFDDFENQVDLLAGAIPQEPARIVAIGTLMKGKGVTKGQIITAANNVLQVINDAKATFQQDLAARQKTGIADRQTDIQNKQAQIQKLNEEIAQLNGSIADNTGKLAIREQGFNQCWGAVTAKLNNDLNNINSFVQE